MCNHLYILDLLDLVDLDLYSTVRYSTGTGTISPVPYLPNETDTEMRDPAFPLSCCMLQLLLRMQCMEAVHTVPVSAYQCQLGPVSRSSRARPIYYYRYVDGRSWAARCFAPGQ